METIQIKDPRWEEKAKPEESRCTRLNKSRARRWRRRARIKIAGAQAIQIKGPQREDKGKTKDSGCRRYTNQGPAKGAEGQD